MTAIAGIIHDGQVWIGADSCSLAGTSVRVRSDPKAFTRGPFVVGCAGSWRDAQMVRYSLDLPSSLPDGDLHEWCCTVLADRLRTCLRARPKDDISDGRGRTSLLIGAAGRLFHVDSALAVGERAEPYDAIGCGRDLVLGSLHTTARLGCFTPETRLEMALSAAERYSAGVRGPWCILSAPALCAAGKGDDND